LILFNIIHMSSVKGWSKAMSTCGSHIISVGLFYGTGLLTHMKPSSAVSGETFLSVLLFYVPYAKFPHL
jgi:olfactory receptor